MNYQNDDLRIKEINELLPPVALLEKFPATENAANTVAHARNSLLYCIFYYSTYYIVC